MSDLADIAAPVIENRLERQINRFRRQNRQTGVSSPVCAVCGEPIPLARQQAVPGCRLCFDCQKEKEKRKVQFYLLIEYGLNAWKPNRTTS